MLMGQNILEIIFYKESFNICNNFSKHTKYFIYVLPFLSFFMSIFDDSVLKGNTHRSMIINMQQLPKLVKINSYEQEQNACVWTPQRQDYVQQDGVQALVKPSGPGGRPRHHGRADLGCCLSSVWSKLTLRAVLCGKVIMRRHCRQRHTFSILQNLSSSQQLEIQVVTTQKRDFNLQKIFFTPKKT